MQKYGFTDARDVLERASARETAARVAAGAVAKMLLAELGVDVLSHVVQMGPATSTAARPTFADLPQVDESPVRCFDPEAAEAMIRRSRRRQRTAIRWAASSRCWPTACRSGSAATSTGTASSTPSWPRP